MLINVKGLDEYIENYRLLNLVTLSVKCRGASFSLCRQTLFCFEVLVKCEYHNEDGFKLEQGELRPQK